MANPFTENRTLKAPFIHKHPAVQDLRLSGNKLLLYAPVNNLTTRGGLILPPSVSNRDGMIAYGKLVAKGPGWRASDGRYHEEPYPVGAILAFDPDMAFEIPTADGQHDHFVMPADAIVWEAKGAKLTDLYGAEVNTTEAYTSAAARAAGMGRKLEVVL